MENTRIFTLTIVLAILISHCLCESQQVPVGRNVKDYGAKGDGKTDDSAAIIAALTNGRNFNPSTLTPAHVYFPGGTYLITQTLPVVYYTQMVGDHDDIPVIKFVSSSPVDVRVLEAEGPWYKDVPQNNFYRQIRNFVIDMTSCESCTGIHWQVAQATSLTNMVFKMGPKCQGMWMENGSGGFFSDLTFEGGRFGMWVGNQQFTSSNIVITGSSVSAIYLNWDWGWTFIGLQVSNSPVGIDLGTATGSLTLVDSKFNNVSIAVRTSFSNTQKEKFERVKGVPSGWNQSGSDGATAVNTVVLDNIAVGGRDSTVIVMNNGKTILQAKGTQTVRSWAQGHIWNKGKNEVNQIDMSEYAPDRPAVLAPQGTYFHKARPYYPTTLDVTTLGVVGDGKTDITKALQAALLAHAKTDVLFFPHGTYLITDTVLLPPGTRMMGEAWSMLMAAGTGFSDEQNPKPMLQVGEAGDVGVAELSDFLITTRGPQPGAKLIEWNIHEPAGQPGACGMWDVHFRVGGAVGTNIEPSDCPADGGQGSPASACSGAWVLLHTTPTASLYLQNTWGWTADHDIDQTAQINVYNARGFLCESAGPIWLYGTAMEHNTYYQYNFHGASNVLMAMIQTETPYYQPSTRTPWNPTDKRDPKFCTGDARCQMALALNIYDSEKIFTFGAGLYSFFNVWNQDCLKTGGGPTCQIDMVMIRNSQHIYTYALSTYGSVNMLTSAEQSYASASQNTNTFCSTVAVDLNLF